ncbi:MAG: hypothetical protein ABIJ21_04630 [Nanoarchaeota archaeon]
MKDAFISYIVLAELVFVLFSLFSSVGSLVFLAATLLVFVNGLFLFGMLLVKRPWSGKEWFGVFVVFLLFIFLYDRFIVDVFSRNVELLYVVLLVILFAMYFQEKVRLPARVSFARPQATSNVSRKSRSVVQMTSPPPQVSVSKKRVKKPSAVNARKHFIAEHFGSGLLHPVMRASKPFEPAQSVVAAPVELPVVAEQIDVPVTASFNEVIPESIFHDSFTDEVDDTSPLIEASVAPMDLVASTNGKKFHMRTCMVAQRILKEKQLSYTNPVACLKDGFVPCGVCNPLKRNASS